MWGEGPVAVLKGLGALTPSTCKPVPRAYGLSCGLSGVLTLSPRCHQHVSIRTPLVPALPHRRRPQPPAHLRAVGAVPRRELLRGQAAEGAAGVIS